MIYGNKYKYGKLPYRITMLYGNCFVTICQTIKYMVILPYNINAYHKKSCKCVGKPEIHKWRGTASWNIYVLAL